MSNFSILHRRNSRGRMRSAIRAIVVFLTAVIAAIVPRLIHAEMMSSPLLEDAPRVILEEIAWAGSSLSIADEWIELANLGNATASVGGWQIRGAGESGRSIFLPPDAEIGPRRTYVIANYKETDAKSAVASAVGLATTTVSLSNSALGIELRDAGGTIVDRAGDGGTPFAGTSGAAIATMIRATPTSTGDAEDGWISAASSRGYKEGATDLGTPGFCDVCAMVAEESAMSIEEASAAAASMDEATAETDESTPETSGPACGAEDETDSPLCAETTTSVSSQDDDDEATGGGIDASENALENESSEGETTSNEDETAISSEDIECTENPVSDSTASSTADAATETGGLATTEETGTEETEISEAFSSAASSTETGNVSALPDTATSTSSDAEEGAETGSSETGSEIASDATSSTSTTASVAAAETSAPPIEIGLSEIVSNPESGSEWIELTMPDTATATDRTLFLYDAQGKIATIAAGTAATAPGFLVITLASAKLNNSGDEASLRETDGRVIAWTGFGTMEKGSSWAKDPGDADDVWRVTTIPTPGAANVFPPPPAALSSASTASPTIVAAPTAPKGTASSTAPSPAKATKKTAETKKAPVKPTASKTTGAANATSTKNGTSKQTATKQTKKTAASASAASSKSNAPRTTSDAPTSSFTFDDMFDDSLKNIRVRVSGTVGSIAKLLGSANAFILLNADGRGLIVYLPKYLHVPPFGSTVRLTGKLSATSKGPELRMGADDVWISLATSTPPVPRAVDLLLMGAEDAWSLTTIEGAITAVNASSFAIEADDGTAISVSVPAVTGFRAKRLAKGDRVRAIGLADPRKSMPTLLARSGEEIEILEHAKGTVTSPTTAAASEPKRFPGWAPFGAAGGAIVATGAGKRIKELLKQRKLRLLAKAS